MSRRLGFLAGAALCGAMIASGLVVAPAANAEPDPVLTPAAEPQTRAPITSATFERAIAEARAAGAVTAEKTTADGSRIVTIDAGNGFSLELNDTTVRGRLSAGSDSYGGLFVGFNNFDQNLILGGAAAGMTAGICVLGPAVCAVATVAIVIATAAVSSSGGVQCGTKSLRVYPVTSKKPRCA